MSENKKAAAACGGAGGAAPAEDDAPSADAYRLAEDTIDMSTCLGRKFSSGADKRWKPAIYRESQCGAAVEDDCDLCKTCQRRIEKFAEDPAATVGWLGRVTEDPPGWCHMLGTEWAETKKPKWLGGAGSDLDDSAEMSSVASSVAAKKAKKVVAAAAKKAEKAAAQTAENAALRAALVRAEAAAAAEKARAERAEAAEAAATARAERAEARLAELEAKLAAARAALSP